MQSRKGTLAANDFLTFDHMYITDDAEQLHKEAHMAGTMVFGKPHFCLSRDMAAGAVFGRRVQCEGASAGCAENDMRDDVKDCGCTGPRVRLNSDQDRAIRGLIMEVLDNRSGGMTVLEHSAVGDAKGNDRMEHR